MTNQLLCKYKAAKSGFVYVLIAFFAFIFASSAQSIAVSGTVSDSSGPLPGVSVIVSGTNVGTATDFDGNYTINAPSDGILLFSYVGFNNQEIPVNGQSVINVTLSENLEQLGEVVVVGYGVQRKEAVTGAVSSIRGEEIREVPASNVTQALQGRLPGVEFSQTSSRPGAPMQILIRGQRSLTASNDPLIVLDGIPFSGSIADINPNDIEGIDVLKDASATAIYGSRGANGVIMITTNRGQLGQKAQLRYNTFYGLKSEFGRYPMMNGPEFAALRQAAGIYTNGPDESDTTDTDWQDLFYGTGIVTSHDISVTGGTETGNYNFNLGYHKDEAIVPIQEYERFSLRGTLDQKVGDLLRFGFTTNNNYSILNGGDVGVGGVLAHSPLASPYDNDGNLRRTIRLPLDEQFVNTRRTFENFGDAYADQEKVFGSYNNIYAEVNIPGIEGLKYRANLGMNLRMVMGGDYRGEGIFSPNPTTQSNATTYNELNTRWLIENLLTYDRTFAEKHQINFVGLYSAEQTKFTRSSIFARDIPADHFQYNNLGRALGDITVDPDTQNYYESGLMSYMARLMYSYDNRYMISATVRSDGSSRLSEGNKWHTYPAISVGWNIGNEAFMENVGWINLLKLRAGYGETSNQAIDPYKTLGLLDTRPYNFGDNTYAIGNYVTQLPNSNLGWEYSTTYNIGLDFGFLNNRLSGSFEYYQTNTNDLLLNVNLPSTSGVNSYTANIGETENKGWELSLNGSILDNPDGWTWDVGLNIYSNKNELVALASGAKRDEGNWWFVGEPINVIFDYERQGLWQEGDPHINILEPGGAPGMIKVKYTGDFNPDGTPTRAIGPDDRQVIKVDPDFQGGFNTRIGYKGFDLSAVGVFKSGGTLISTLYGSGSYLNLMSGRTANVQVDYWTPENTDAKYPAPDGLRSGDNLKYQSTSGYFDATYLKVRTISLGYTFRQETLGYLGLNNLRLYFTVQNPFVLFSDYHKESGMDPETNSYGNENAAVPLADELRRLLVIGTNTPTTRNYLIGLNVTF